MRLLFRENIDKSFVFCHLLNALVTVSYHGEKQSNERIHFNNTSRFCAEKSLFPHAVR